MTAPEHMHPEEQFMALFDEHADRLFARCMSLIADRDQALEFTRETFKTQWTQVRDGASVEAQNLYQTLDSLLSEHMSALT